MQSIWAFHVFPSRSSSWLQTPEIRFGSSIAEKALATHSKGNIYRGEVETDNPFKSLSHKSYGKRYLLSHSTEGSGSMAPVTTGGNLHPTVVRTRDRARTS
jgi:hypothetical protein